MTRVARNADVDSEAAAWAVRLEAGELTDADRHDLEAWLEGDVRHVGALVRAQAIWVDLDRVAAMKAGHARHLEIVSKREPRTRARDWTRTLAGKLQLAAAAAAVLVCAVSFGVYDHFDGRLVSTHGEVRRVALSDGSTVILDSDSIVQVKFHPGGERTVFLRQGEASFQVAHDKTRPFIVHANDVAVRAVGTSFAVKLQPDKVSVTVAEGTVLVKRPIGGGRQERHYVTRNGALVAQGAQPMKASVLSGEDVARQLAWRDGQLDFNGESVVQAAAAVNRYATRPVIVDDPRLSQKTFVGVFRMGDSKAFADTAAAAYDDQVIEQEDGLHIVSH
ncbi:MAG TPA: FecR domain-containing protein [Caulobacteraceae bacterium]|jgi:transmembrane sensor